MIDTDEGALDMECCWPLAPLEAAAAAGLAMRPFKCCGCSESGKLLEWRSAAEVDVSSILRPCCLGPDCIGACLPIGAAGTLELVVAAG